MDIAPTRRKVLGLLMIVGIVAGGAGAGTMAYFHDTQHSNNNVVSAGTLDLQINGNNQNAQVVSVSNAKPGDSGSKMLTLSNNGTIKGNLSASFNVTGQENGFVGPEPHTGKANGSGQLTNYLQVKINGSNGNINTGWHNASWYGSQNYKNFAKLSGGESTTLNVYWKIPSSTGNVIQSDSATVNATINLNQDRSA